METARKIPDCYKAMDRDVAARDLILEDWMILQPEYVTGRHFGRPAWLPRAWEIRMERIAREDAWRKARETEQSTSEYVGSIGARSPWLMSGSLPRTRPNGGVWGVYKLTDESGNILIRKTTSDIDHSVRKIKATVKDHTVYDGVKQTLLTRCKAV